MDSRFDFDYDRNDDYVDDYVDMDTYFDDVDMSDDIPLDDIDFENELDTTTPLVMKGTISSVLTRELSVPEYDRGVLDFVYQGVSYQGVPMVKMNDKRFVFKLVSHDNTLKAFNLSDIRID
jgi:hypothetical protein